MVEQWQIKAVDAAAHLHRQAEMSSEPVASVSASLNPPAQQQLNWSREEEERGAEESEEERRGARMSEGAERERGGERSREQAAQMKT